MTGFLHSHKDVDNNDCIEFEYASIESIYFKVESPNIRLDTSAWGSISIVIWDSSEST